MEFAIVDDFISKLNRPYSLQCSMGRPNVIAILDEFSVQSFSKTANLWLIDPERPQLDIDYIEPDFLFVESAWSGNSGRWRYMVTSSNGPKEPLRKLIKVCKDKGIPTIFWNKEDPPHFDDFVRTAKLFDFVFTSDLKMVPEYEKSLGRNCADLMRFAAEPTVHNPQRVDGYRQGMFAFAGQYFSHRFPERRQQMEILFPAANHYGLDIYSRELGSDPRYQFPSPFDQNVVGSLPYNEMVKTYRKYKAFINVNSVVDSETMCARRVFELSACKTAVMGMESKAIRSIFGKDEMLLAADESEAAEICRVLAYDDNLRDSLTQRAWRKTLSSHTYQDRMNQILDTIGIQRTNPQIRIHAITREGNFSTELREMLNAQVFTLNQDIDLRIVDDGLSNDENTNRQKVSSVVNFKLLVSPNYEYGPYFVNDLLLSLLQSEAEVVTKAPRWMEIETETFVEELDMPWGYLEKLDSTREDLPAVYVSDSFDLGRRGYSEVVSV